MDNTSGIHPVEYKVLIRPIEVEDKIGSIIIPDEARERDQFAQQKGVIVETSPLAFTYDTWPDGARVPQVGDTVFFAKYAGATEKGLDGAVYRLVNDKDIAAVIEG